MNTVIVPIDFSPTSLHAAKYAAQLLSGHYGVTMVLYHSYSKAGEAKQIESDLEDLKTKLMNDNVVKMEVLAHHEDDFVAGLERAARHRAADLVIMGITGKSSLAQVFFGSNTLKMAETKVCPVLIVPESAPFVPIKNVMLTSDFKKTFNTTPSVPIKAFLDAFHPQLHIVNVDEDHFISLTEEYEKEKQDLKKLFADYKPEFYFMRLYDVDEALNLFAETRNIDMIIVVQKDKSFIERFFKSSRTKKLTYHSKMPILVVHE
jgi:nucleotide-binding universal stress UspA family protein